MSAKSLHRQSSTVLSRMGSNPNVLPFDLFLRNIHDEIQTHFSQALADAVDAYIRTNEFEVESIKDDIDSLEDSFLISEMAEQFSWQNDMREASRFQLLLKSILNPEISMLTRMKSVISLSESDSELLVFGFLRSLENESEKYDTALMMSIVPNEVIQLCVRYFQRMIVYGVGRNDRGEFGIPGRKNCLHLTDLEWTYKRQEFVLSSIIPCTINGIAYISTDGDLWLSGLNHFGQFGLNHSEKVVELAVQHPFYTNNRLKVKDVSHGKKAYHMFVLTVNGGIYCHGANEWGQCGIGRQVDRELEPVLLELSSFSPQPNNPIIIDDIKCGIEHSIFLTTNGTIYGCGHNKWGQLAFPNRSTLGIKLITSPRLIDVKCSGKSVVIHSIHCGDSNTYCIDDKNRLWSWGRNDIGALGIDEKDLSYKWQPSQVTYFERQKISISKLASGSNHVLVLDVIGKVYSWGYGKYGCCGDGESTHRYKPNKIMALDRYNIVDISCGSTHSIAVSDTKSIWAWGVNDMNQCCIDTFDPNRLLDTCQRVQTPRMVDTAITKLVSCMTDVIGVRTATNSTLFIVEPTDPCTPL